MKVGIYTLSLLPRGCENNLDPKFSFGFEKILSKDVGSVRFVSCTHVAGF